MGTSPIVHFGKAMGWPLPVGYNAHVSSLSFAITYLPSAVQIPKLVTHGGVIGRRSSPSSDCTYTRKSSEKTRICFPSGKNRAIGFRKFPVLMTRDSPAPVGSNTTDPPSAEVEAKTHLPSSEMEDASKSPTRTAGEPSVFRM